MASGPAPGLTNTSGLRIVAPLRNTRFTTLANTAQAKKRARQAEKHRAHNTARRSLMRTEIKKVLKAVAAKDQDGAKQAYRSASSMIDRLAAKGLVHKNTASRYKSRLNTRVRALAS